MPLWQKIINFPSLFLGILIKQLFFIKKGLGKAYLEGISEGLKEKKKIRRVKVKNNLHNYINIELGLIKNTINLLKRG